MGIIEELRSAALAVGMTKANASACMRAADTIEEMRDWYNLPDHANLRCLESSVKNLIATLCRHDVRILRQPQPTGTISGDLYATVANTIGNSWTDDTLSDLQRRYPLPRPIAEQKARPSGSGELPGVPGEVRDGERATVDRRVCGSADVGASVTFGEAVELGSRDALQYGIDMGEPGGDRTAVWYHMPAEDFEATLEQARSTTRRNILQAISGMNGGFPPTGLPQQDVAVAIAVLRKAVKDENEAERNVQELERQLLDATTRLAAAEYQEDKRELVLRQAIKSRDGQIKSLQAQVDKLARYIAFQVAK